MKSKTSLRRGLQREIMLMVISNITDVGYDGAESEFNHLGGIGWSSAVLASHRLPGYEVIDTQQPLTKVLPE
jgi:hypothetical protein